MKQSNVEITRDGTGGLDYTTLRRDIATRLRNTCGEWSREDFDAIVEKVTLTTMKFPPPRLRLAD